MFNNYYGLIASTIAFMMLSETAEAQKTPDDIGYFEGRKYLAKPATEKLEALWQQCLADPTVEPVAYDKFPDLFTRNIDISYTR